MKNPSYSLKGLCLILITIGLFIFALIKTSQSQSLPQNKLIKSDLGEKNAEVIIEDVFIAQTHVLRPEDRYFILTANRETLLKVNITAADGRAAPEVTATLTLGSKTTKLKLTGPVKLPQKIDTTQQSFENSFTVDITPEWVQPGLTILIKAGNAQKAINNINIGADNTIRLRYFDFRALGDKDIFNELNDSAFIELQAKLPVSKLDIIHAGKFDMPPLVLSVREIIGYEQLKGITTKIVTSRFWLRRRNYLSLNSQVIDNLKVLQKANGEIYNCIYAYGLSNTQGGLAFKTGFSGLFTPFIFLHELGHVLGLPHNNYPEYPYKGDDSSQFKENVGPVWAYDPVKRYFIPPTIQKNSIGGKNIGWYKHDPEWSGRIAEQEKGYYFAHFSDYNMCKMKTYIDSAFERGKALGINEKWDKKTNCWVTVKHKVWELPLVENIPVYSLYGVASITLGANLINNPLAYTGNLIRTYDSTNPTDKKAMKDDEFCNPCNLTLKLIQGGKIKFFAINSGLRLDTASKMTYDPWAINVAQSDGQIELMQLFYTPDLVKNGFSPQAKLLKEWNIDKINIPNDPQIGGMVWSDENRDGKRDENEKGIAEVKIVALRIKDIKGNKSYSFNSTVTTDENGNYWFADIEPGTWQLFILGEPNKNGEYMLPGQRIIKEESNFSPNKTLCGYRISPGENNPNDKIKGINYGIKGGGELGGPDDWVLTKPFRIEAGGDPYSKVHPNSILTIDFGFYK